MSSSCSANGSPSPSKFNSAEKRAVHNALERKRRDHIKDMFSQLKDSVPNMAGEKISTKASRAQILKKACDYIQSMRRKNVLSAKDLEELAHQVLKTRRQIGKLESLRATNRYVDGLPGTLHSNNSNPYASSLGIPISVYHHLVAPSKSPRSIQEDTSLRLSNVQVGLSSLAAQNLTASFPLAMTSIDSFNMMTQLPSLSSIQKVCVTDRSGNIAGSSITVSDPSPQIPPENRA